MDDWMKRVDDLLEKEEDDLNVFPKRMPTGSIDVSSMVGELDDSGSYYFGGIQTTSFGKLLECLPIGCFLLDEKGKIIFLNSYWEGVAQNFRELRGARLSSLVIGDERAHEIGNRILRVYESREPIQGETVFNIGGSKLFGRFHIRSVRMGSTRYLLVLLLDLTSEKKQLILAQRRKRELLRAQEQLKRRLEEKEVLLGEIHHRVKNSLQLVSSLLALQGEHARDQRVSVALREAGGRIWSMALVHEALYRTGNLDQVSSSEYMSRLLDHLVWSSGIDVNAVHVESYFEDFTLNPDTAVNCGLVLNELLSNCFKHAFSSHSGGLVKVSLVRASDGVVELRVADDGIGMPLEKDLEDYSGYGFTVVKALVGEMQGTMELKREHGSEFIIRFRENCCTSEGLRGVS